MNFLEAIAIFLLVLILVVIVNNIFLYGRDLAKYPKRAERDIERDINNYYPGSRNDDYDSDYDSDSSSDDDDDDDDDDKHAKPKPHHKKHYNLKPQKVAHYVSSHMPRHKN